MTSRTGELEPNQPSGTLSLTNWPLVQDGWRSMLYVLLSVAASGLAGYVSGSRGAGMLATLVILISTWRFWLPVRFQLGYAGIVQSCMGRRRLIPWRSIRRCEAMRHGVLLFFTADRSLLGHLSSVFIGWRDHRDEVLDRIESATRPANSNSHSRRMSERG